MNEPINMVLHCPECGFQHIDEPDGEEDSLEKLARGEQVWLNPPHRSHKCGSCGIVWRPADVPTNGVQAVSTKGKDDNWPRTKAERFQWLNETKWEGRPGDGPDPASIIPGFQR